MASSERVEVKSGSMKSHGAAPPAPQPRWGWRPRRPHSLGPRPGRSDSMQPANQPSTNETKAKKQDQLLPAARPATPRPR